MQYSLFSINIFFIIVAIGSYLSSLENNNDKFNLLDYQHSPLQYIEQLKGHYYINPVLSLSLAISLFSFMGIPPLAGFFAKQSVLSAALQEGHIFLCLIAVLTSVIGGVYYLMIIKAIFFDGAGNKKNDLS
jgi:NADH-ubiquinone oxidoreductase chain 2